jgi:hypothetical protein
MLAAAAAEPSSTIAIVGLVVAIISLAMSVAALTWQIVQWRLTGSVIVVENRFGFGIGGRPPLDELISIDVRNIGRTAVTVTGWGLQFSDDSHIPGHAQNVPMNPRVPLRIEAGDAKTFYLPLQPTKQHIQLWAQQHNIAPTVRGYAALGTGGKNPLAKTPLKLCDFHRARLAGSGPLTDVEPL